MYTAEGILVLKQCLQLEGNAALSTEKQQQPKTGGTAAIVK